MLACLQSRCVPLGNPQHRYLPCIKPLRCAAPSRSTSASGSCLATALPTTLPLACLQGQAADGRSAAGMVPRGAAAAHQAPACGDVSKHYTLPVALCFEPQACQGWHLMTWT